MTQHSLRYILLFSLSLWLTLFVGAQAQTISTPDKTLSATHYLIPGFSTHLIRYGRLIYHDLLNARAAAKSHHILDLRISLADASGHLLQMGTPPKLAPLHNQMVSVQQALATVNRQETTQAWQKLITMIQQLPMYKADNAARIRLLKTANKGLQYSLEGRHSTAWREIADLIAEIEVPKMVFPMAVMRKIIGAAVLNAAEFTPKWSALNQGINLAIDKIHWITSARAARHIHAFDALVAAYVAFPDNPAFAHLSLRHAAWWLGLNHIHSRLRHAILVSASSSTLKLHQIDVLQTHLAQKIHLESLPIPPSSRYSPVHTAETNGTLRQLNHSKNRANHLVGNL